VTTKAERIQAILDATDAKERAIREAARVAVDAKLQAV